MSWMTLAMCDRCGTTRSDPAEKRWVAAMHMEELGWRVDDDRHLCPDCQREAKVA